MTDRSSEIENHKSTFNKTFVAVPTKEAIPPILAE